MDPAEIGWNALLAEAIDVVKHAYCPYSNFPVGVAGLAVDDRLVSGYDVENAGYGITLCAECGMVSDLIRSGSGALVAIVAVNDNKGSVAPCGRCCQLICEHGGSSCLTFMPDGVVPMTGVLPGAFGPHDLSSIAQMAPASSEEKKGHDGSL